jgi:hypothetical protein
MKVLVLGLLISSPWEKPDEMLNFIPIGRFW